MHKSAHARTITTATNIRAIATTAINIAQIATGAEVLSSLYTPPIVIHNLVATPGKWHIEQHILATLQHTRGKQSRKRSKRNKHKQHNKSFCGNNNKKKTAAATTIAAVIVKTSNATRATTDTFTAADNNPAGNRPADSRHQQRPKKFELKQPLTASRWQQHNNAADTTIAIATAITTAKDRNNGNNNNNVTAQLKVAPITTTNSNKHTDRQCVTIAKTILNATITTTTKTLLIV